MNVLADSWQPFHICHDDIICLDMSIQILSKLEIFMLVKFVKSWFWNSGINHVFTSGALVVHATMHAWGCLSLCAACKAGRPHECMVVHPAKAPDIKTWLISLLPWSFSSKQSNHTNFEAELSTVESVSLASNQCHLTQQVRRYAQVKTSQWSMNVNKAQPRQAPTRRKTFKWTCFMMVWKCELI